MLTLPGVSPVDPERAADELFIAAYMLDCNERKTAKRLGWSRQEVKDYLERPEIAEEIRDLRDELIDKLELDRAEIVKRLTWIASSDMRDIAEWSDVHREMRMSDDVIKVMPGVKLHPSNLLLKSQSYAVAEISNTKEGVKIKMGDKRAALMDIAKILGFVTDKSEVKSTVTTMPVDLAAMTDEQLTLYSKLLESMELTPVNK